MNAWRSVALAGSVALTGAAGTVAAGAISGMGGSEVAHLALLMLPAVLATLVAAAVSGRLLSRASLRQRMLSVAVVAVVVSVSNLGVLAGLMFVSAHDASLMAALLVYSVGAGVGSALVLSRGPARAMERLVRTSERLAAGDLQARAGRLHAGPELDALASALDDMVERLQASVLRERAAEGKRRDLITAVSHDLRTPLAGLRAMVEAIDEQVVDDPPTLRRYAAEMRRQVESLVGLVDDLFELVQLDAGAIEAEDRLARLDDVIGSAVKACQVQASEKGLVLEQRLDGAAGVPCSPRLVRVLQNLLQNAIRHSPAEATVLIEARRKDGGLEVAVADTGEGIEPESLDRVFEPFWRGDRARSGPGSGLGLALAKRIVESLGGDITVRSEPSGGSRFAVRLPGQSQ